LPKVKITLPLYSSVILIYLLTTRGVPGYPISYPVGYPGNELPDNGSPTNRRTVRDEAGLALVDYKRVLRRQTSRNVPNSTRLTYEHDLA